MTNMPVSRAAHLKRQLASNIDVVASSERLLDVEFDRSRQSAEAWRNVMRSYRPLQVNPKSGWHMSFYDSHTIDVQAFKASIKESATKLLPVKTMIADHLQFTWDSGSPTEKVPSDNFIIMALGEVETTSGTFVVDAISDDGIRIWVDDQLVIDKWKPRSESHDSAEIHLDAGVHNVKVEYFEVMLGATLWVNIVPKDSDLN